MAQAAALKALEKTAKKEKKKEKAADDSPQKTGNSDGLK